MARLEGKIALITGGAAGIGEASARLFVREGASVVIVDIDEVTGAKVAGDLGEKAVFVHGDVTVEEDVKSVVDLTVDRFGRLDCLFNNAGAPGPFGPIEGIPVEDFDRTVALLLRSAFLGMKYAAPVMKCQGSGSIITTSSVAGFCTGDSDHSYAVAKAGVIQLTKSAAMELGESGVRVNCISPGFVVTSVFQKAAGLAPEEYERRLPAIKAHFATMQSIQRAGLAEDVAQAALWLAGDESSFVNGHNLVVDGGRSNGRTWSQCLSDMGSLTEVLLL